MLPNTDEPWGAASPNLLVDPGLESVGEDGPWTTAGSVRARKGLVSLLRWQSSLVQRVTVVEGGAYLLVASAKCSGLTGRAVLTLRWFDAHDAELGVNTEWVLPGTAGSDQFLWHVAPQRAAAVSVELTKPDGTRCDFDEAALYGPA